MRWTKVDPRQPEWSSAWLPNQTRPVCVHASSCNCGAPSSCGSYPLGGEAYYWPFGCTGPRWLIRCEAVGMPGTGPSGPPAPLPVPPAPPAPPPPPPAPSGPVYVPVTPHPIAPPNNICPKHNSTISPPHPGDSAFVQCEYRAQNDQIVCEQNNCGSFTCGDMAAAYANAECLRRTCTAPYLAAMRQCSTIYGGRR